MNLPSRFVAALMTAFALAMSSATAFAAWELDGERSALQFMSVKNASVAELHHFKVLTGGISDSGDAQVVVDLDSVETLIPIRNQRMRELLFETVRFPSATISADVPSALTTLAIGESRQTAMDIQVDLHGSSVSYNTDVLVTRLAKGGLQVVLSEPVVVKAADFALGSGIETLREVAGLKSISTAVPVSGQLVFTPTE